MNVKEINPDSLGKVSQYIAIAVALAAVTIWVIVAYQRSRNLSHQVTKAQTTSRATAISHSEVVVDKIKGHSGI